jgi:hypothetical protein
MLHSIIIEEHQTNKKKRTNNETKKKENLKNSKRDVFISLMWKIYGVCAIIKDNNFIYIFPILKIIVSKKIKKSKIK